MDLTMVPKGTKHWLNLGAGQVAQSLPVSPGAPSRKASSFSW